MSIGTLNLRILIAKVDLVQNLFHSAKLDVIGITQTWQRPTDRLLQPLEYESFTVLLVSNGNRGNSRIDLASRNQDEIRDHKLHAYYLQCCRYVNLGSA